MSLILDALKKAQEEKKKITAKVAGNLTNRPAKSRRVFCIVVAGALCVVMILLLLPELSRLMPVKPMQVVKNEQPVLPVSPPVQPQTAAETKDASPQVRTPVDKEKGKVKETEKKETRIQERKGDKKIIADRKRVQEQIADAKKRARKILASPITSLEPDKSDMYGKTEKIAPAPVDAKVDAKVDVRRVDDEKTTTMYNEALRQAEKGNIDEAKRIYVAILTERPDHVEALNNLGAIAMREGKTREALLYFKKILEYKKDYGKAYNNIGLIMMHEGDGKLAEEYFKKSIEIDKDSMEPYLNLSALLRNGKRFEEASRLLSSVLQRGEKSPAVYLSYALIKDEMGQYEDAIKYYRYFLREGGKNPERNKVADRLKYLEESQFTKHR